MPIGLFGPPILEAPWSGIGAGSSSSGGSGGEPPAPPSTSPKKPFLTRVPDLRVRKNDRGEYVMDANAVRRLASFTEKVIDITNSLIGSDQLTQTEVGEWQIDGTGGSGLSGTFP